MKNAIQRSIRLIPGNSLVSELEKLKTHLDDVMKSGGDLIDVLLLILFKLHFYWSIIIILFRTF